MKENVIVLLSSYNGEKYIIQQLDSIKNQIGVDVYCLVRDDGSSDSTVELVSKFCKDNPCFSLICGKNVGIIKSFNSLILNSKVQEFNWIAFCDQDDIWLPDKLVTAIDILKERDCNIPLVYGSNLMLVDKNLNKIGKMRTCIRYCNKYTALIQNCANGCTMVFNKSAWKLYIMGVEARMEMHDYWMFLVGMYLGEFVYDEEPRILYRQHDKNVIGGKTSTVKKYMSHIIKNKNSKREAMLQDFIECYNTFLSDDVKIIKRIIYARFNMIERVKVLLSWKYVGYTSASTIAFKIRMMLGRMY